VGIDPHFVDMNHLNFQLRADSPAHPLGCQNIPLEQIGPDPTVPHAPWPATVTLVQPFDQSIVSSTAKIAIDAVLSDPTRTATGLDFWIGNAWLGSTAEYPYRFVWSNAPPGDYTLTAQARGTNTTLAPLHTVRILVQDAVVAPGSVWSYLDNGSNQGTAWRAANFDDSAWHSGPAQLGYGDGGEATTNLYGPNPNNKNITTYYRRAFTVAVPARYANLVLGLLRDDGAVVYLNGDEIYRSNMPVGPLTYTTLAATAVGDTDESTFYLTNLSPALLRAGTNILAVETHQASVTSSDISFDLYLYGLEVASPPSLWTRRSDTALVVEWPLSASDYFLQSSPSLSAPAWTPFPAAPAVTNGRIQVMMGTTADQGFFRLEQP